jgi:hypothetical protein
MRELFIKAGQGGWKSIRNGKVLRLARHPPKPER